MSPGCLPKPAEARIISRVMAWTWLGEIRFGCSLLQLQEKSAARTRKANGAALLHRLRRSRWNTGI